MAKPILMEIGRIIRTYDNEKVKKELVNDTKIDYNALKRESEDYELYNIEKRGNDHEHNISEERRLSNTEYNDGQTIREINREIRSNEKEILDGEQKRSIPESITDKQIDESFNRNQRRSNEEVGIDRRANEIETVSQRGTEGKEPDGMGTQDEQYTSFSGGDNFEGTYSQLTLFPTIQQQKDAIEIGATNNAPIFEVNDSSIKKYSYLNPKIEKNIPHEYIIYTLKHGSVDRKFRIQEFYKSAITATERAKLIKKKYGLVGCGWAIDGFGLHGYDTFKSKGLCLQWKDIEGEKEGYITWQIIEKEIAKLISKNEYISEDELKRYTEKEIVKAKAKLDPISQHDNSKEITLDHINSILDDNDITNIKDELSFLLDNENFFEIHISDNGYDYTFYDSEMHLIDGGLFILEGKKDDKNILEATKEIIFERYGNIGYSVTDVEIIENTNTVSVVDSIEQTSNSLIEAENSNKNPGKNESQTSINESNLLNCKNISTNFKISNDNLGIGNPKEKYKNNIDAILTLKKIENEQRFATVSEQEILSKYVGWGGLSQAFEEHNSSWTKEYKELKNLLSEEEYASARGSTLNAHYTSPTIIRSIYDTIEKMGFRTGNILEPAMGIGNFFGMLPESMRNSKLYGIELDDLTGRISRQLYPAANIKICGFEKYDNPNDFFDIGIGNVPFGQYKVSDRNYDKYNFLIHDYFFAKTIDKVRPGGIVVFITSKGTLDKQNSEVRKYIAQRADLLGALRLPNNAFLANAGTEVTSDIIFLKKRDRVIDTVPNWVHLSKDNNGLTINEYFVDHPEMIVGKMELVSGPYGLETTCQSIDDIPFEEQLKRALNNINGQIENVENLELDDNENDCIPADPSVKNYSFTVVDEKVYFRENSIMRLADLPGITLDRIKGMVEIRNCTNELIQYQLEEYSNEEILNKQRELNKLYDEFSNQFGLINSQSNKRAFNEDSSYCLLCSLEKLNDDGTLKGKADMFIKRTIKRQEIITSVDTSAEALTLSLGEKAKIDLDYMSSLTGKSNDDIVKDLEGVIFKNPITEKWETSDEYLSGNVREKLNTAKMYAESHPEYTINVVTLEKVQPKQLDASEIEVRLGATWIDPKYIDDFMVEVFKTPNYLLKRDIVRTQYSNITGQWNIQGKNADRGNVLTYMTYGTSRANAYKILEDSLNLRDVRIFDVVIEDGKEKRVLNKKETMLVSQKQESIRETFKDWIFKDPDRREVLCKKYNEIFNSTKPREYDGSHLKFPGMTPDIEKCSFSCIIWRKHFACSLCRCRKNI